MWCYTLVIISPAFLENFLLYFLVRVVNTISELEMNLYAMK
jgi:hypothetical protein